MNKTHETITTVLPNLSKKKGLFSLKRDHYTLVLTPQRMVFALFSKELYKQQINDVKQVIEENKKNKTGFFASMTDRMLAYTQWFKRYENRDINEIINETSGNLVINKNEVISLKVLEFMEATDDSYQENTQSPVLLLKTKTEKYKFVISPGFDTSAIKDLKNWLI